MVIEQYEPVTCDVAKYGSFVLVRVPLSLTDAVSCVRVVSRYRLGDFVGRTSEWSLSVPGEAVFTYRIPAERFCDGARLELELVSVDEYDSSLLWSAAYEMGWENSQPMLTPAT